MDLEEELQKLPIGELRRVEHHFDRFRVRTVVAVRGIRYVAAAVAHPRGGDARQFADQILHSPEAAAGEDRRFRVRHLCPPIESRLNCQLWSAATLASSLSPSPGLAFRGTAAELVG